LRVYGCRMSKYINTVAIIVAAGSGSRAGGDLPKQYRKARGHPILRHSYKALVEHSDIKQVYVIIGEGQETFAVLALEGLPEPVFVTGGATRRDSVRNGLQAVASNGGADRVLIHDAARPFLSSSIIDRLLQALDIHVGAVPALPVVDSLARGEQTMSETLERQGLWRIQTPQAFAFNAIWEAHQK
jgi:2-C-methyl-D-erythritol 4-phosphate cytidylyltransferase / 2-C-methyl-D-erythritol 2,4-cyclodiphosphate synthase